MDATVLEENCPKTLTIPGLRPVGLLRVVTVPAAPAVVTALLIMVMLVAEAGAPHTGLAGEPVAKAITEAGATQTATSPVSHAVAMMPVVEFKKYDARSPPRQATMTASPPSPLDFAICFSQRNSSL
jgi:hypothetical protein